MAKIIKGLITGMFRDSLGRYWSAAEGTFTLDEEEAFYISEDKTFKIEAQTVQVL